MFKTIITIFNIPDLRKRIFFTLGLLFVFRVGTHITIPGVNFSVLESYLTAQSGGTRGILDYLNLFAGGAFNRLSIFALGIMPYISASIVMQLMIVVIPSLQRLQKEGELGRKKITQYTRYGTVFLCAIQAYGIAVYIRSINNAILSESNQYLIEGGYNLFFVFMVILIIVTGTMVLVWLGELITERGIGNGISLLVFAGIISSAPAAAYSFWIDVQRDEQEIILLMILCVLFIIMIALSIVLTEGVRKVPLQYGKRLVGRHMVQASSQVLPIKVNAANVMPIIFAASLLIFPSQLANMLVNSYPEFVASLQSALTPGTVLYFSIYVVLIIFFAYFYTALQYNPKDISTALKKNGGFIPGVRPGIQTQEFIQKLLNRITLSGSIFLAFIAITPDIIIKIWSLQKYQSLASLFGGTSLLIIVGVTLDTLKQIESQIIMRQYEGFMDKNKKVPTKGRVFR